MPELHRNRQRRTQRRGSTRATERLRRLSRLLAAYNHGDQLEVSGGEALEPLVGRRLPADLGVRLRYAFPDDDVAIARLAALDSAAVPAPPLLLAEVDGHPRAALALASGELIGDPFHPTAALGELLRLRARQLRTAT